jgi:hypothetical protein
MQKQIKFDKGTLAINYCNNLQDIIIDENGTFKFPLKVSFIPNVQMTEKCFLEYSNKIMNNIIVEINSVILENKLFYDNFETTISKMFTSHILYRNPEQNNKLLVLKSYININCVLKN